MNYYVSDLHFGHSGIIRMCDRPFQNVDDMDENLIQNWNQHISENDDVFILGDFCYKANNPKKYLSRLHGHKHLVVGNHDGMILKNQECRKYFEDIRDIMTIKDKNQQIVLCHYPMIEWNGYFRDTLHFYGHIHNKTTNDAYRIMSHVKNAYNVGTDILDFTPRTLEDVIQYNIQFKERNKTK